MRDEAGVLFAFVEWYRSPVAWVLYRLSGRRFTAITLGYTVHYRWGFVQTPYQARLHEDQHIRQVRRYGRLGFLGRYLWQWMRVGFRYRRIPLEIEARLAAGDPT